ncbi:MAG: hypothetical protein HOV94_16370 [Saccharothrix sp.]|nr:hypothetical protein [Saccharothrix sp.]
MTAAQLRAAAALVAAALALTACCGGNAASDDGKSFIYWSMRKENEPQAQVLAQAAAEFEKETGIVEVVGTHLSGSIVDSVNGERIPFLEVETFKTVPLLHRQPAARLEVAVHPVRQVLREPVR